MIVPFLVGLLVGLAVGVTVGWWRRRRQDTVADQSYLPAAAEHVIELLRRAHAARVACLVRGNEVPVIASGDPPEPAEVVDRAVSVARLAMGDGREHVVRGPQGIVGLGDGRLGAAVVLTGSDPIDETVREVSADLRQLLAEMRVEMVQGLTARTDSTRIREAFSPTMDTLPGVAFGLCERAKAISGRSCGVVWRDQTTQTASVIAVSPGSDRRLIGLAVSPESAVGRACIGDAPVIARSATELFGRLPADRRRREDQGTAYPLRDGREGVGALVVFGPREQLGQSVVEELLRLTTESGGLFAAAAAVKTAEEKSLTDALTGLPNRSALERAMGSGDSPCAILCVDIDHFKRLNDSFGHAAGDAALKHMARLFRATLRGEDMPARIGGEEFALWLPGTPQGTAMEIAERVRAAIADAPWEWAGAQVELSCSIGVASVPATTTQVANLLAAADAALYRAKRAGRNRVEAAKA